MSPQCITLEPNLNFSPKTELIFLPQIWSSALVNGLLFQQKNVLRPAFAAQASPQHIWGGAQVVGFRNKQANWTRNGGGWWGRVGGEGVRGDGRVWGRVWGRVGGEGVGGVATEQGSWFRFVQGKKDTETHLLDCVAKRKLKFHTVNFQLVHINFFSWCGNPTKENFWKNNFFLTSGGVAQCRSLFWACAVCGE